MASFQRIFSNRTKRLPVARSGVLHAFESIEDIQREALAKSVVTTVPDPLFPLRLVLGTIGTIGFIVVLPYLAAHLPQMLVP